MALKKFMVKYEKELPQERACEVAEFLSFPFDRARTALPSRMPVWLPSEKSVFVNAQDKLKQLLGPALDDLADGRVGSHSIVRLVLEINALKGNPYRFEQKAGKANDESRPWERKPAFVDVDTVEQYYLALIAELFAD